MPDRFQNAYKPNSDKSTRPTSAAYDPKTNTWDFKTTNANSDNGLSNQESNSDNNASKGTGASTSAPLNVDKDSSKGIADKEYKEIEINTLVGDLDVVPNNKTIQIQSGDTINILGIGRYLSGLYFVNSIKRKIDNSNGYSHGLSVIKNGFAGNSLKGNVAEPAYFTAQKQGGGSTVSRPAQVSINSTDETQ
jgi:hypothetical protein